MARGRWFVTPHAVRQYIQRVRPRLSFEEALEELVDLSWRAHRVKEIGPGIALWRGPRPLRLRCIVSEQTTEERPWIQLLTVYQGKDPEWQREEIVNG